MASSSEQSTGDSAPNPPRKFESLFILELKEDVVQVAFGKTLPYMNTPQKIEFIMSWLIILLLVVGYLVVVFRRLLPPFHIVIAGTMFFLLAVTLLIPWVSVYYGIARVYFTALPIVALYFIAGAKELSERTRVNSYALTAGIIGIYALSVSGVMYSWFGIVK